MREIPLTAIFRHHCWKYTTAEVTLSFLSEHQIFRWFLSHFIFLFLYPNMDFPVILIFAVSLSCFGVLLLYTAMLNPVFALKSCDFPAIFNFGDSNSDTGGLSASFSSPKSPYGETYFHRPAGRYTDGRVIVDFMAKSFGLPYLSAYLDSLGTNFKHGANFATSASTIRLPTHILPGEGGFSPFDLNIQYFQFAQFKVRSQMIRQKGGIYASLMPDKDYFPKALYTFDIGQNDLGEGFFTGKTIEEVNASIPDIVNQFSDVLKNIYKLGARFFWIHNTGPIGCLPYVLANFSSAERDNYGCAKPYNDVAQYFNQKLKEAIVRLRIHLPLAAITYIDVYSVKYSLFVEPEKHGFELPLVACCGYGSKYNYSSGADCGETIIVNGSRILVDSCESPLVRVTWDGIHYTEAANKFIFDQISTGAFSDPPTPLKESASDYFCSNKTAMLDFGFSSCYNTILISSMEEKRHSVSFHVKQCSSNC